MRFRIKKQTNSRGDVLYFPECRKTWFHNYREICTNSDDSFSLKDYGCSYDFENLAIDLINKYKTFLKEDQSKTEYIKL